jgi:hypothetical protein
MTSPPTSPEPRRYRFPPLVRTGLFGSMPAAQVLVLAVGCGISFVGILLRWMPWALIPALLAAVVAFARVGGWPLYEVIPMRAAWLLARSRGRDRWFRPLPLLPTEGSPHDDALPPPMAGLQLLEVDAPWVTAPGRIAGIAAVHDTAAGLLTGVLKVSGDGQFPLASPHEQDARVSGWGDAFAACCRERATVSRVTWQEWSTSTPVEVPTDGDVLFPGTALQDYWAVVRHAPRSVVHETLVSISVDLAALPARRSGRGDALETALQLLVEELRLFSSRLEAAGLAVVSPLSPAELNVAVRMRSTPFAESQSSALRASLAAGLGVAVGEMAPMAVAEEWEHVRVDRTLHRSWWVEGWPRLDVPARWMELLLLANRCTRTVTVVFEPIPPSRAARAVDEAAVALESAETAKTKQGFRVRVSDRRAREEVERREHELVAGYGDFAYCGLVTVAGRSIDELDDAAADFEQSAGHAGLQLRPLEGRHGAGWVAALPLGRTVASGRHR